MIGDDDARYSDETERVPGSAAARAPEALGVGLVLGGRYEIQRVIGEGGAGRVYRAHDRVLGDMVAVKVLRPDRAAQRSWIRRLAREVKVARAIRHPNVCRVYELGQADGHWFVTMELADGGTLSQELPHRGPGHGRRAAAGGLEPEPARAFEDHLTDARAVCAGLAAFHAVGIAHRDVTPGNVLRMRDGRLVISDFGLAVGIAESTTFHGGTPQYMAPEVLAGARADARADVWQLGIMLHEILFTCRPDWEHRGERTRLKPPPDAAASPVTEALFALVVTCLAHDPAQRPESAIAVAGLLTAAENAKPRTWSMRLWQRGKRAARWPPARAVVLSVALGAVAVGATRVVSTPRLCLGGPARVAGVWAAPERERIGRAFVATGRPHAAEVFAQVSRLLDDHLAAWVSVYRDSCEATQVRGEQSGDVLDLRTTCLNEDLEAVRALVRVFSDVDASLVDNAAVAAGSLNLARCSEVARLRSAPLLPRDPLVRGRVQALRRSLEDARALFEASRTRSGARAAAVVVADADTLGYEPLIADALIVEGEALVELHEFSPAIPLLERAVALGEKSGNDRAVARAAAIRAYAEGLMGRDPGVWPALANAALSRIGGDPQIAWLLAENLAGVYVALGDPKRALESGQEAVRIAERAFGPEDVRVGRSLNNVANAYEAMGQPREALASIDRAMPIDLKWMDAGSVELAKVANNRGECLLPLGRLAEAHKMFTESLATFEREASGDDLLISAPLTGLGRTLLALGRPSEAVAPLERALRLRERGDRIPSWVAEAEFNLGRALEAGGGDRRRALHLAQAAAAVYAATPGFERQRAEVAGWLEGRGG